MAWNRTPSKTSTNRAKAFVPRLRREMSDEERKLWWHLRHRIPLQRTHFRRQVPLGPFVVDFCCLEHRLIIEIDGAQHGTDAAIVYDARRDLFLQREGYRVLRFTTSDVNRDMNAVLDTIFAALFPTTPTPYPSPQGGGEPGGAHG
jgi:very-short-patch-repair endonuclease